MLFDHTTGSALALHASLMKVTVICREAENGTLADMSDVSHQRIRLTIRSTKTKYTLDKQTSAKSDAHCFSDYHFGPRDASGIRLNNAASTKKLLLNNTENWLILLHHSVTVRLNFALLIPDFYIRSIASKILPRVIWQWISLYEKLFPKSLRLPP